jgi:hypothetical protein
MVRRLAQGAVALASLLLFAFAWRANELWFDKHVFLPRQFCAAADRGAVAFWRGGAAALGLALLLFGVPTAARWPWRRLLVALLLGLVAGEGLLRWRMRKPLEPEAAAVMEALTTFDPRYGHTLAPSIDRTFPMSGRNIRWVTDSARHRTGGTPPDPALPSLVFTGESTMVGHGLQWEETFPALLGARLGVQVVNLASFGYRSDQSWLRLADALPTLAHPQAVVAIFMPGLLGRNFAGLRHPPVRQSPTGVEYREIPPPDFFERLQLYQLWMRMPYLSNAAFEEVMVSTAAVLRQMAALSRARGAPCVFLVMGHPAPFLVHDLFEVPGLDHLLLDLPNEEFLADGHPSPRGAIHIADALEPRLRSALAHR